MDSLLHEKMPPLKKNCLGNRDTKQNAKLESLLAASLTIVGNYHNSVCF